MGFLGQRVCRSLILKGKEKLSWSPCFLFHWENRNSQRRTFTNCLQQISFPLTRICILYHVLPPTINHRSILLSKPHVSAHMLSHSLLAYSRTLFLQQCSPLLFSTLTKFFHLLQFNIHSGYNHFSPHLIS